MMKESDISLIC